MIPFLVRRASPPALPADDGGGDILRARYVVVDTELTGLDEKRDAILSLGAVRMEGGRILLGGIFHRVVSPRTPLSRESVIVHGITPDETDGQPGIRTALEEFYTFLGEDVLVGHFISLDLGFLEREGRNLGWPPKAHRALDTVSMFHWLRRRGVSHPVLDHHRGEYRLHGLAQLFGIEARGAHRSDVDAYVTAQLFQRFLPLVHRAGITTVERLLAIAPPFKGGDPRLPQGEITNF
jgi:DNA polymerase-3 subunit epsilon